MTDRVGLVVVSHSAALADATVELAMQMAGDDPPAIATAAGTEDGGFGTDANKVLEAIEEVGSPAGVLVVMDLGSAVLSAELSLDMLPEVDGEVRLTSAPLVEGVTAAVVAAAGGQDLDAVEREARNGLAGKQDHLGDVPADDASRDQGVAGGDESGAASDEGEQHSIEVELVNPDGLHARPAARLATAANRASGEVTIANVTDDRGPVDARSSSSIATLGATVGDVVRLTASGPDAEEVLDELRRMVEDGFGELDDEASDTDEGASSAAGDADDGGGDGVAGDGSSTGGALGVSPGRGAGPVVRLGSGHVDEPAAGEQLGSDEREDAVQRLRAAADDTASDLRGQASSASGPSAEVLDATASFAEDPAVLDEATTRIRDNGTTPERAVWEAYEALAERFRDSGSKLAERVVDVLDVRDRVVRRLTGQDDGGPGLPSNGPAFVLVATELTPAVTARLTAERCAAIVTARGGRTSHAAIIARSLGIPAVSGVADLDALEDGRVVLVDGDAGDVVLDPDDEAVEAASGGRELVALDGPGHTADDQRVELLANVAGDGEVGTAVDAEAEGVGLLRTELLFMGRDEAPDVDEQRERYVELLAPMGARKVVVRTLDAGSDKPLGFVTDRDEANPALGVRGLRVAATQPELLDDQLAALAAAADEVEAELWVMAPMVATRAEAAGFVERCRDHGLATAGIMVETPSAAMRASELCEVVDFVSIGTNDLTQYTMAADREHDELAELTDPWQPAVLDLVAMVGEAGREHDTPVGVCGAAASDPDLAAVLVGLGVTSLSMPAPALADVAARLAATASDTCRAAAEAARAALEASEGRTAAKDILDG